MALSAKKVPDCWTTASQIEQSVKTFTQIFEYLFFRLICWQQEQQDNIHTLKSNLYQQSLPIISLKINRVWMNSSRQ